jgi:hypothetical protein
VGCKSRGWERIEKHVFSWGFAAVLGFSLDGNRVKIAKVRFRSAFIEF